jgi:hypothetical protein
MIGDICMKNQKSTWMAPVVGRLLRAQIDYISAAL